MKSAFSSKQWLKGSVYGGVFDRAFSNMSNKVLLTVNFDFKQFLQFGFKC